MLYILKGSIVSAINVAEFQTNWSQTVRPQRSSSVTERNVQEKGAYVVEKVTRVCDECVDVVMEVLMMDGTGMRSISATCTFIAEKYPL